MQEEIWKDIVGYEGIYQVSNFGNVKSLTREVIGKANKYRIVKSKILKTFLSADGYCTLQLYKNGIPKTITVHRLVAITFIEKNHLLNEVNHKDFNRTNNRVENLEWCTHKENVLYSNKYNPKPKIKRDDNGRTKIKEADIENIIKDKRMYKDIAKDYNVKMLQIYRIKRQFKDEY